MDTGQVPDPTAMGRIEGDESSVRQRGDELDDEEGIAAGLLVDEVRKRLNALGIADERVGEQPPDVMDVEWYDEHLGHARAGGEEPPEHHLESDHRLLRRELRYGRLLADDELDLRNEIRNQLPVRAERASDGIAPPAELGVALAQHRADDAPQGLREGRIRNVPLVLVGLSAREQAARSGQRLLE